MEYSEKSIIELREIAKSLGIKSVTTYKKSDLIEKIHEADKSAEGAQPARTNERTAARTVLENNTSQAAPRNPYRQSRYQSQQAVHRTYQPRRTTTYQSQDVKEEVTSYNQPESRTYNTSYRNDEEVTDIESLSQSEIMQMQSSVQSVDGTVDREIVKVLDSGESKQGILEIMPEGFGFIRCDNFLPGEEDVYVSPVQIRRYQLRSGDMIRGNTRQKTGTEKFSALLYIDTVNGFPLSSTQRRKRFETLTPIFPNHRIRLETDKHIVSTRMVDLLSPIGKGQRGMIVSQPKAGKTTLLKQIARAVQQNNPEMHIIILLIDERPEEVTDMKDSITGDNVEIIYSTFDESPENHKRVSEMVIERARRLVEHKMDVMILLDSITRLARAYNLTVQPSGRTLSGGLDPAALLMPKKFFGAARNMREGGSLTILATALVDTGSRLDDMVFEEFKGTGNMELVLDREMAQKRIYPAIDLAKSGTRRDDLLFDKEEASANAVIKRALSGKNGDEQLSNIVKIFKMTDNNQATIKYIMDNIDSEGNIKRPMTRNYYSSDER